MKLRLLVIPLLLALALSPLAAAAATGSITFTSPSPGASLSGTQSYTISGTISPTPSLPDDVFIEVQPQGSSTVLDFSNVAVTASGTFSYTTNVGGNSEWVSDTYVITATDSNGATGTTTFEYVVIPGTTTTTSTTTAPSTTSTTTPPFTVTQTVTTTITATTSQTLTGPTTSVTNTETATQTVTSTTTQISSSVPSSAYATMAVLLIAGLAIGYVIKRPSVSKP